MKKIFGIIVICLIWTNLSYSETVTIGYFELKPHAYAKDSSVTNSEPRGAAVEHFKKVAKKMNIDIEWKGPLPFSRLLKYCELGKLDGAIDIAYNEEWEKNVFYFPNDLIFKATPSLAIKNNNSLNSLKTIDDIAGYRIGFVQKVNPSKFLLNNLDKINMSYLSSKNWLKQSLFKLNKDRLDAVYDLNKYSIQLEMELNGFSNKFKILPLPEDPQKVYTVFSKASKNGADLLKRYNEANQNIDYDYDELIKVEIDFLSNK